MRSARSPSAFQSALVYARRADDAERRIPTYSVATQGLVKNYNTIEEFKAADKTALFNELSDEVCSVVFCGGAAADCLYRFGKAYNRVQPTS